MGIEMGKIQFWVVQFVLYDLIFHPHIEEDHKYNPLYFQETVAYLLILPTIDGEVGRFVDPLLPPCFLADGSQVPHEEQVPAYAADVHSYRSQRCNFYLNWSNSLPWLLLKKLRELSGFLVRLQETDVSRYAGR